MANGFKRDTLGGAEIAAQALARVGNLALQRQFEQRQRQQALDQVRLIEDKKDERVARELAANLSNLEKKIANDNLRFQRDFDLRQKELKQRSKENELSLDNKKLRNMMQLMEAERQAERQKLLARIEGSGETGRINQLKKIQAATDTRELYDRLSQLDDLEAENLKPETLFTGGQERLLKIDQDRQRIFQEIDRRNAIKERELGKLGIEFTDDQGNKLPSIQFGNPDNPIEKQDDLDSILFGN